MTRREQRQATRSGTNGCYPPESSSTANRRGAVTQLTCIALNVSSARAIEAHALASEARFRALADAMPQIVYVAGSNAEIESVNKR